MSRKKSVILTISVLAFVVVIAGIVYVGRCYEQISYKEDKYYEYGDVFYECSQPIMLEVHKSYYVNIPRRRISSRLDEIPVNQVEARFYCNAYMAI